jgi:FkbM family methyltransferase
MMSQEDLLRRIAWALQENIREVIVRKIQRFNTIVVCGTTPASLKVIETVTLLGKRVSYFTSFHTESAAMQPNGIQNISFEDLANLDKEETLICVAEAESSRIITALIERRFKEYIDFTFLQWPAMFDHMLIVKHRSDISEMFEMLCDAESRATFLSVLEYRITGDPMRLRIAGYPQYFHPVVRPRENDLIIDGGAFTGDTALDFSRYLNLVCKIYSFEPGKQSYQALLDTIQNKGLKDIVTAVKAGLWSQTGRITFDDSSGAASRIVPQGTNLIEVLDLDSFMHRLEARPTLIKLDVEGAELEALKGAKDIVARYLPRLQVCVYHQPTHLWEIPPLIKKLSGKYRIFLGHHWLENENNWNYCETVAYAIADST